MKKESACHLYFLYIALFFPVFCSGLPLAAQSGKITLTTSRIVGQRIKLITKTAGTLTIEGATEKGYGSYELTAQTIVLKGEIINLYCDGNDLIDIDLSSCPSIETLACYNNALSSLDISASPRLANLSCFSNQLTEIKLPAGESKLANVECFDNKLKGDAMHSLLKSLPEYQAIPGWGNNEGKHPQGLWLYTSDCPREQNEALKSDVTFLRETLGWPVFQIPAGKYQAQPPIPYEGIAGNAISDITPLSLVLYPDLATNEVHISGTASESEIRLYSITGLLMQTVRTNTEGQAILYVGGMPRGIYLLQVGNISRKFIRR